MTRTLFSRVVDERFLAHRLRSTSIAGMAGGALAMGLFVYHWAQGHGMRWDLFAVGAAMVVVKVALLVWYRLTD